MDPNAFIIEQGIILDVRSPSEYAHAHIPGSLSFPLFSDEERAQVGTLYKQVGKEAAFDLGLSFVQPKMVHFVTEGRELAKKYGTLKITCARGGMRSESMAWLLSIAGMKTCRLTGGYKAYRQSVLAQLSQDYSFVVIGGLTGSGKSDIIEALANEGAAVLDLEKIANHRGSSFGSLGPQPSFEQFENELAHRLAKISDRVIFVEDESRLVGSNKIPDALFDQIRRAPLIEVKVSKEERVERILRDYGKREKSELCNAFLRIEKRLGTEAMKKAIEAVNSDNLVLAIDIALDYYDRAYDKMMKTREPPKSTFNCERLPVCEWAKKMIEFYDISPFRGKRSLRACKEEEVGDPDTAL